MWQLLCHLVLCGPPLLLTESRRKIAWCRPRRDQLPCVMGQHQGAAHTLLLDKLLLCVSDSSPPPPQLSLAPRWITLSLIWHWHRVVLTQTGRRGPAWLRMILMIGMLTWQTSTSVTASMGSCFNLLPHLRSPWSPHPLPKCYDPRPVEGFRHDRIRALHATTNLFRRFPLLLDLQISALPCRGLLLYSVALLQPPQPPAPVPGPLTGPSRHRDHGQLQHPPLRHVASLKQSHQHRPPPPPPPLRALILFTHRSSPTAWSSWYLPPISSPRRDPALSLTDPGRGASQAPLDSCQSRLVWPSAGACFRYLRSNEMTVKEI